MNSLSKKYIIQTFVAIGLALSWILSPSVAMAAISQVQTKTGVNLDTNSPAVTLDSAATAGNLIVSCISTDKSAGTYTAPNGFTIVEQVVGSSVSGAIAYKKAAGGETTITWGTTSFTSGSAIWTAEYSEVNTFDVSEESDSGAGTGTSRTSGTTATTAEADSLAIACFGIDTASNFGSNLSFTNSFTHQFTDTVSGGSAGISAAHKILSATGTQETTGSWTTADQNYGHIAVFNFVDSPVALVQEKTAADAYNTNNGQITVTLDSTATSGNLLVTAVAIDKDSGTITAPSGFTMIEDSGSASSNVSSGAIAYKVSDGTETSITWDWVELEDGSTWVGEYSGLLGSSVLDVSADNHAQLITASATISTGTTGTTAQADELAVAVVTHDSINTAIAVTSWTNSFATRASAGTTSGAPLITIGTKILTATGTVETTATATADQCWAAVATFKAGTDPIVSASNQTFGVGDSSTEIATITITANGASAINTTDDIRIRIPSGFNMNWDESDTTATIGGDDSSKVSTTVSYEDSDKTLVIDVTTNFDDADNITISGLSFDTFSATSSADNLELELDNAGGTDGTDIFTITVVTPEITIASSTDQPDDAVINSTDVVLGSASIVRNAGTGTVTAVVIKENGGTVEADSDLNNIELWLSSDDTWDALDEQLGSAGEFNGVDGTVTKTETFNVTTTTQYLIVRGDIDSTASASETIEIQIESLTTSDTVNGDPLNITGTTTIGSELSTCFQEGVSPTASYSGEDSADMRAGTATTNYGSTTPNKVDGSPDEGSLIKFDLSSLDPGATVSAATLVVNSTNSTPDTYEVYEVKRNWVVDEVTWNEYSSGNSWSTAGAQNTTNDRGSTILATVTGGTGDVTITFNASGRTEIEDWIDNPSTNYGVTIQDYTGATDSFQYRTDDDGTAANRPELCITYEPGTPVQRRRKFFIGWAEIFFRATLEKLSKN